MTSLGVRASLLAFVLAACANAYAACGKDPECDSLDAWVEFNAFTLKITSPDSPGIASWRMQFDHRRNDILVDVDIKAPPKTMAGKVAMVGGRVMLSQGLVLEPGYEIDALDGPVLGMKLVMSLLARAFPRGPAAIAGTKTLDHTGKVGIKYATPSASGYVPAPWRLKGNVAKRPGGAIGFDLTLTMPAEGGGKNTAPYAMRMAGELSRLDRPVFEDSMPLASWTTYGVGPREEKKGDATILDYGATADRGMRFRTIADIRTSLAEEDRPGAKDASKDFTGFWKEKCDEPFGLQVMHYGEEGKYSIVFCGPGGCGDPAGSRLTFITGDKHYQVVSEDELIEIRSSGERDRYLRCTRDTHPILEYRTPSQTENR